MNIEHKNILIILLIVLIVLIVGQFTVNQSNFSNNIIDNNSQVYKSVISHEECNHILQIVNNKTKWGKTLDTVDHQPEQQIDVLNMKNGKYTIPDELLWKYIEPLILTKLNPIIKKSSWINKNIHIDWVFIRKYTTTERTSLCPHFDTNYITMNILLCPPDNYTGCDLFIFPNSKYKKLNDIQTPKTTSERMQYVFNHPNLPIKHAKQGDVVLHTNKNWHGVLPITSGERYVLVIFWKVDH